MDLIDFGILQRGRFLHFFCATEACNTSAIKS